MKRFPGGTFPTVPSAAALHGEPRSSLPQHSAIVAGEVRGARKIPRDERPWAGLPPS